MGCINWDLGNGVEDEQKRGRRKSQHWHYKVGFGKNPEQSEIDVRVEENKRLVHYCDEINKYKRASIMHIHSSFLFYETPSFNVGMNQYNTGADD